MSKEGIKIMVQHIQRDGVQHVWNEIEAHKDYKTRVKARKYFTLAFHVLKTGDYRFKDVEWPISQI